MAGETEDVKPKLNLNVNYQGNRKLTRVTSVALEFIDTFSRSEITVKVKANTPFKKIFEAAEVCYLVPCSLSSSATHACHSLVEKVWQRARQVS